MGLRMQLTINLDQRSPISVVVTFELSTLARISDTFSTRGVTLPSNSPARNTTCSLPPSFTLRRTAPGSHMETEIEDAMQPTVRSRPTTPAMVPSLMPFCRLTMKPPSAR